MISENRILFSIIVPIYNIEQFLPACVESLINQTYSNMEIILVDDGSADDSSEICDNYAAVDCRVQVVHKKNGGHVSARQMGVEVATGDYVVCVDGDDWIDLKTVETFHSVLQKNDVDIVCCGYEEVLGEKHSRYPLSVRKGMYTREDIEREIFPQLISSPEGKCFSQYIWAKAYRRELFQTCHMLLNPRINNGEDLACTRTIFYNAHSLYVLDDCLYCYRVNRHSITRRQIPHRWDGAELIGKYIEEHIDLDQRDFREQLARRVTRELYIIAVTQFRQVPLIGRKKLPYTENESKHGECFQKNEGYREVSYQDVRKDVINHLKQPYYLWAIKNCKFSYLKGRIFRFAMLHNWTFFMWLHCKTTY